MFETAKIQGSFHQGFTGPLSFEVMHGRTDQDDVLFLRRNYLSDPACELHRPVRTIDCDPGFCTRGDWLVTLHIAYGLYEHSPNAEVKALATESGLGGDEVDHDEQD